MIKKAPKTLFLLSGVLFLVAVLSFVFLHKDTDPRTAGLTEVQGYVDDASCDALTPSCGLCYGQVIDKKCYVDKAKLTPEQLRYVDF